MKNILSAVDELHKNGIMHRDIKPENILLRSKDSFECVIADFGLAEYESSFPFLYTRCGTPGYVAPEIMRMKNADEAYSHICDIFSIGVIFHILLLNRSVFRAKSHKSLVLENKNCSFDFERE